MIILQSDKFVDIIGEISIAKDFGEAMRGGDVMDRTSPAERIQARQERIHLLTSKLKEKLSLYTDAFPAALPDSEPIGTTMEHIANEAMASFRFFAQSEADQLKTESHGVELLNSIGYTYSLKSNQWSAAINAEQGSLFTRAFGFGGRITGAVREKVHIISDTAGILKTAIDLQQTFTKLKAMEKQPEDEALKAKLESEAATSGMQALWRGSKLEVEGVLRQVCDDVLGDTGATVEIRQRRVAALKVLGEVYSVVKADESK